MIRATYHGHACLLLDDGSRRIIIDPFLTGNPKSRAGVEDVCPLDAILVTHGHADHLGDAVELSKRCGAPVVAPFELAAFCQGRGASVQPIIVAFFMSQL